MPRRLLALLIVLLTATACGSGADDPAPGTAGEADGDAAEPVTFVAGSAIPVELSLDADGRSTSIFSGYRAESAFGAVTTTCTVDIIDPSGPLEPGDTAEVTLSCEDDVVVAPDDAGMTATEGGRHIGEGTVLLD